MDGKRVFIIGDKVLIVEKKAGSPKKSISIILFTTVGKELLNLIQPNPEFNYFKELAQDLSSEGISVKYANLIEVKEDMIRHTTPLMDVPEV